MKLSYRRIIFWSFFAVGMILFAVSDQSFAASQQKPKQNPAALKPPIRRPLSPLEIERQHEAAIKKRQKAGRPVDPKNVHFVRADSSRVYKPGRDYTKQSCYHMQQSSDPEDLMFCDANRCTFPDGGYCEHKTRDCYTADGALILNENGTSQTEEFLFTKWDLCLEKDGSPVVPKGDKPFDEKIKAGCGYRVGKKIHPYLIGYIGYMMTCDEYRCIFHPGAGLTYNRQKKLFVDNEGNETKVPPSEYYPYLDWKCLSGKQANRVASKYRCSIVVEDGENWGCKVCFQNGKHVYKNCKYHYNEKGEIAGTRVTIIPELLEQLDELTQVRYTLMERNRPDIVRKMGDLEEVFHMTPVSDEKQKRVVALFEDFFERKDEEGWSDARLGQELALLNKRVHSVMRK